MRFTEIDSLTLESHMANVFTAIFDHPVIYSVGVLVSDPSLSEDEIFYKAVDIQGEEKPEYSEVGSIFEGIKAALKEQRSEELFNSVNVANLAKYLYGLGVQSENYESYIRNKANNDDQEFFDMCVGEEQKYLSFEEDESDISFGSRIDDICLRALRLIKGMNSKSKRTTEQIAQMKSHFKPVHDLLKDGEPLGAYTELQLMTPIDGLVPQSDIDRLANFLNKELAALKPQ